MFHFNWEEVRLKLDVQGQRGRRMLDVDGGQEGRGVGGGWVLENLQFSWTSYVYRSLW